MKIKLFIYLVAWSSLFVLLAALVILNFFPGDKIRVAISINPTPMFIRSYDAAVIVLKTNYSSSILPNDNINYPNQIKHNRLLQLKKYCADEVRHCYPGKPCRYKSSVDFRIIPIVYNRATSLLQCLESLRDLDTLGDKVSIHIWVDRSNTSKFNKETVNVGWKFALEWTKGPVCVHVQKKHAYITGQWIDTWSPPNNHELALILEDDVSISPHAYHWLRSAHSFYRDWKNVSGYTLEMEGVTFFAPVDNRRPMNGPSSDVSYMYPVIGTTGFMPHPRSWRRFQKWYHNIRQNADIKPYVPGIIPTEWYMMFEAQGRQESMWEMWHIYFTYLHHEWCVYPNIMTFTDNYYNAQLAVNRQEAGLHFEAAETRDNTYSLLTEWDEKYVKFPNRTVMYSYDGIDLTAIRRSYENITQRVL